MDDDMHGIAEFLDIPVRDDATELSTFERGPRVLAALGELGIDVAGKKAVDLGAGFGSLSIAAAEAGAASVLAVDVNQGRLDAIAARAAARGAAVDVRQANLLEPWAGPADADYAFVIGVVEYAGLWNGTAPVDELQRRVFRAAYESLRKGGRLVFGSKNRLWPRFIVKDVNTHQPLVNALPRTWADRLSRRLSGEPYRHHIHSPRGWAHLIRESGFSQTSCYFPYLSYQFPLRIVEKPSFRDLPALRRLPATDEERGVAWGRAGTLKAGIMAAGSTVGLPTAHSVIVVARK